MTDKSSLFRKLPSVDSVLAHSSMTPLLTELGRSVLVQAIRQEQQNLRAAIQRDDEAVCERITSDTFFDQFVADIKLAAQARYGSTLSPVFNLTGTVIHTNLGRSKLPREAIVAMEEVALQANNLEFDLEQGKRGDRDSHLESVVCDITGAEAATVVNNNAAAVMLVLSTFAQGREVLISRGELVEIGGSFRIPDVMASAGCILREVGTTNRTHLKDFRNAINDNTALIMQVHTSNYEIQGFTNAVPAEELSALAKEQGLPFVSDLGSGTLIDLRKHGLPYETTVQDELSAGARLVTFSGDKLLGGPQAGLIVGDAALIERVKSNPLKRALRVDKVTLAALLQVLNLYRNPESLKEKLPTLADLTRDSDEIKALCERVLPEMEKAVGDKATVDVEACKSQIGSGSLPTDLITSFALAIRPVAEKGSRDAALNGLLVALRKLPMPVIGRIHDGALYLDLRCLRDEESFVTQLIDIKI